MAEMDQIELDVRGMTCDSCALHVTKALKSVGGVQDPEVPGWQSGRATVHAEADLDAKALSAAVQRAGYTATVKTRKAVGSAASPDGGGGQQFDLLIIGGGSAGFAAAIKGAELGFKVALVEAGVIGGTCVNIGCVPSKTLIRAVELYHLAGQHRFRGMHTTPSGLNWPEVVAHKDELVSELRQSKYADVLAAYPGITYIQGRARLTGKSGVEIDGAAYTPGKIVIATGARPSAPPIAGLSDVPYLDSTSALERVKSNDNVTGANRSLK